MYIDVELNELIELIRNEHSIEETAEIIDKIIDYDDIEDDFDYISSNNLKVITPLIIKNSDILEFLCKDDIDSDLFENLFDTYIETHSLKDMNSNIKEKLIAKLIEENYIEHTGVMNINQNPAEFLTLDEMNKQDFYFDPYFIKINSDNDNIINCIKELIISYIEEFDCWTDGDVYTTNLIEWCLTNLGYEPIIECINIMVYKFSIIQSEYAYFFENEDEEEDIPTIKVTQITAKEFEKLLYEFSKEHNIYNTLRKLMSYTDFYEKSYDWHKVES